MKRPTHFVALPRSAIALGMPTISLPLASLEGL